MLSEGLNSAVAAEYLSLQSLQCTVPACTSKPDLGNGLKLIRAGQRDEAACKANTPG